MTDQTPIRIWADFNGLFGPLLCISHSDTAPYPNGNRITLKEGMIVTAFMEDENDEGVRDDLNATGIVEPSPSELACLGTKWVLRMNNNGVQHESEIRLASEAASVNPAEAFQHRAQGADQIDFLSILRNAPDRAPDPGDEL